MDHVVLKARHLKKAYGPVTAVDDLSLKIYQGEIFGLLGPNGAGKTTTIKMLCSLIKPDAGKVLIKGVPVHSSQARGRARVGLWPSVSPARGPFGSPSW